MPPTNMPPPGGWGQIAADSGVLASPTDTYYHSQYKQLLVRLQVCPVLILTSQYGGVGKSHMLRQAAEQLVQGRQIVFLPSAYNDAGLHPSIDYAYRHGGIVVISDTNESLLELSLHFANQLYSGNPCLNLTDPERPDMHPSFRYVVEMKTHGGHHHHNPLTYSPALRLLQMSVEIDHDLHTKRMQELFTSAKANEAVAKLLAVLTEAERYSQHLLTLLTSLPAIERRRALQLLIEEVYTDVKPDYIPLLELVEKSKPGKIAAAKSQHKPAPATETDSPQVQQEQLINLVTNYEAPPLPPIATIQPLDDPLEQIAQNLGF